MFWFWFYRGFAAAKILGNESVSDWGICSNSCENSHLVFTHWCWGLLVSRGAFSKTKLSPCLLGLSVMLLHSFICQLQGHSYSVWLAGSAEKAGQACRGLAVEPKHDFECRWWPSEALQMSMKFFFKFGFPHCSAAFTLLSFSQVNALLCVSYLNHYVHNKGMLTFTPFWLHNTCMLYAVSLK